MKLEFKFSVSLHRSKKDEPVQHEHVDTESFVERAEPQRVGFDIPTTGDE